MRWSMRWLVALWLSLCCLAGCLRSDPGADEEDAEIKTFAVTADLTPPVVADFAIAPATIDVTSGAQDVTLTIRITDDLSGFAGGCFFVYGPSSTQYRVACVAEGNRVSGNALNGVYQAVISFPESSESGEWSWSYAYLLDAVSNRVDLDNAAISALGFPRTLNVIALPDTTRPTVVSVTVSPSAVDVSASAAPVEITMHITDDISGVESGCIYLYSPTANQMNVTCFGGNERTSGDALDGTYLLHGTFPRYSEVGTWRVGYVNLFDKAANRLDLNQPDLGILGLDAPLDVASSPSDITSPALTSLAFAPSIVDVGAGAATLTVTARVVDELSGVYGGCLYFYSPSGHQYQVACFGEGNRTSGDAFDGTYQLQFTFLPLTELGTWTLSTGYIIDVATNRKNLDPTVLQSLGLPSTIELVSGPPAPRISVTGMTVTEGTGSNVNAVFTVTLSPASSTQVTVLYATADDTALAGPDYGARSGTLKFKPGVTIIQVPVPVKGDALYEPTERFFFHLMNPVGAELGTAEAAATIVDNDAVPSLSISDVTVVETNAAGAKAAFTVSLVNPSSQTITVDWTTVNGSATAPTDYTTKSGSLIFTAGATSRTLQVPIRGDTVVEGTESFVVRLSNVTNGTIAKGDGVCTITDND